MSLTGVVRCRIPHPPIDGAWAPARGWAPQQRDEYVCKKDEFGSVFGCFALQSGSRAQDLRREGRRTQSLSSASLRPVFRLVRTDQPRRRCQFWVSCRQDTNDDFGWEPAVNLGPDINLTGVDANAPTFFQDHKTDVTSIHFNSIFRTDGPGDFDIYVSTQREDGTFGPAVLVPELSSPNRDTRLAIRRDGLEMFITSGRAGTLGNNDLWVSTRATTLDAWSEPANLGSTINTPADDGGPALSCDGTTLYFYSTRPGGSGGRDLYVTTRQRIHGEGRDDDEHDDGVHPRDGR